MEKPKASFELVDSHDNKANEPEPEPNGNASSGDKTDTNRTATIADMFSTADKLDTMLMIAGTLGGFGTGISMPIFNVLFGVMLNKLNADMDSLVDGVNEIAEILCCFLFWPFFNICQRKPKKKKNRQWPEN